MWRQNSLSLVVAAIFVVSLTAQVSCGRSAYNDDRRVSGKAPVSISLYLHSGHFVEALFENWESEFLEMGAFVLLSVKLRQKGSAESKDCGEADEPELSEADRKNAPWPVRRGGAWLALYEHSLSVAFFSLFLGSFFLHALGGCMKHNEQRLMHHEPAQSLLQFMGSSEFWFESLQNWQSEFLSLLSIIVLTIFLRERGSPQSKPVAAPYAKTGG